MGQLEFIKGGEKGIQAEEMCGQRQGDKVSSSGKFGVCQSSLA